ncbi:MAG: NRDE family protein, partial [Polynucleobacter victoriensis]
RVLMGKSLRPRKVMHPQKLNPGIYGLSNGMLDTPWPKVQHRVGAFAQLLAMDTGEFKRSEHYLRAMEDMTQAPDDYLPQTGVSYEWEKVLSSAFIRTPNYGTRSTSLIRIRKDGRYEVIEKLFNAEKELDTQVFEGQLENFHNARA